MNIPQRPLLLLFTICLISSLACSLGGLAVQATPSPMPQTESVGQPRPSETSTPAPSPTLTPVDASPTPTTRPGPTRTPTSTPVPEEVTLELSDEVLELEGEFAFRPANGLKLEHELGAYSLTDKQERLRYEFATLPLNGPPNLNEAMLYLLWELTNRPDDLKAGTPAVVKLASKTAAKLAYKRPVNGLSFKGKIYTVQLGNNRYWYAWGEAPELDWNATGEAVFDLMLGSVRFDISP
jgi:hypothetical protein